MPLGQAYKDPIKNPTFQLKSNHSKIFEKHYVNLFIKGVYVERATRNPTFNLYQLHAKFCL